MITLKRIYILVLICVFCVSATTLGLTGTYSVKSTSASVNTAARDYPTIVIDSGHGGLDGGASSQDGLLEKDVNLDIALTLNKLLIQSGYNTVMIRETDVSVHDKEAETTREKKVSDIKNRVEAANSKKDNILVSIHQNHFTESKYLGTQVFYSKNHPHSQVIAESIRTAVTTLLQPDNTRKCKESSNVYLLDNATVPSVIVECGFLSNPDEAYLLSKEDYRDKMAYCIYLGILEYIYLNY